MQEKSVLQPWTQGISLMQQTVLMTAIRGPDGIGKYHPCKFLLRWYRRCILLSALDGTILDNPTEKVGGSFTGPSYDVIGWPMLDEWYSPMDKVVGDYIKSLDELPHHFQMHFLHGVEILGYKHPDKIIRTWWGRVYIRLVNDLHLKPETEIEMDNRLGDNREKWLERNDPATVD